MIKQTDSSISAKRLKRMTHTHYSQHVTIIIIYFMHTVISFPSIMQLSDASCIIVLYKSHGACDDTKVARPVGHVTPG